MDSYFEILLYVGRLAPPALPQAWERPRGRQHQVALEARTLGQAAPGDWGQESGLLSSLVRVGRDCDSDTDGALALRPRSLSPLR